MTLPLSNFQSWQYLFTAFSKTQSRFAAAHCGLRLLWLAKRAGLAKTRSLLPCISSAAWPFTPCRPSGNTFDFHNHRPIHFSQTLPVRMTLFVKNKGRYFPWTSLPQSHAQQWNMAYRAAS
ncbi:hypothetical protein [Herbaspirillum sp.]|uniref:hypothetical protein n=1 Tax=Herbaspirillum sp. TaxID=1890675 RepID=UPI0031D385B4